MAAAKSDLATILPKQVEEVRIGAAQMDVWGGEYEGVPCVVIAATDDNRSKTWLHVKMTAEHARTVARALADAAEYIDPRLKD